MILKTRNEIYGVRNMEQAMQRVRDLAQTNEGLVAAIYSGKKLLKLIVDGWAYPMTGDTPGVGYRLE